MSSHQVFFESIRNGDVFRVEELLEQDPTLADARTENGQSAVLLAAYNQQPLIAALLVERGAQLDIYDGSAAGQFERVAELLDRDPDLVKASAPDGYYPLGLAALYGHKEVVELLLDRGVEVNQRSQNPERVSALHAAAEAGHTEIVRILLEHGANPNALKGGSYTPLHAAAEFGDAEMVRMMLEHDGEPGMRTEAGQTALDLAEESSRRDVMNVLRGWRRD